MSMPSKEHSWQKILLPLAVVAVILVLAVAGYRTLREAAGRWFGDFFYPYLAFSRSGADYLSDRTLLLYNRFELAAKLTQQQELNRALSLQAAEAAAVIRENEELRRLCRLRSAHRFEVLPAEIVLRDPANWDATLRINRGEADGLKVNSAAVTATPDGRLILVGVVTQVGRRSAEVTTVLNPALRLSARLARSGATGILNAGRSDQPPGRIAVGYLPVDLQSSPEEGVFTTGFEYGIPAGLKIGEVEKIDPLEAPYANVPYRTGVIKAAAQFNSIRFLLVVRNPEAAAE